MKKILIINILIVLFTILSSCKKNESDELILALAPEELHIISNVGKNEIITIKAISTTSLNKLSITQSINNNTATILLDSSLYIKDLTLNYIYTIPKIEDVGSNEITITVSINDKNGNEKKEARIYIINNTDRILEETAGNEMFSKLASNKNAYDLINMIPLNYLSSPTEDRHIEDNTVIDSLQVDSSLSRTWISPANLKFVRYNNFDYANATSSSVKNAYESGVKVDHLNNITKEDIILTYIPSLSEEEAYYALKIVYIIDDVGVEQDKYIFNIKH